MKPGGIFGSVLGAPPDAKRHNIKVEAFQAHPDASRLYEIAKTLSLSQIQEAHREAENHPSGKIVLKAA
jgi:NADPH:quinone reductase-like Zn-dependent oxidoreductase